MYKLIIIIIIYKETVQKTDEDRLKLSSGEEYKVRIENETKARQKAEDKIGSLQHRSSMLELDLEHKKNEMTTLKESMKELQEKLDNEGKKRTNLEISTKKMEEEYQLKLTQREQELRGVINEMKTTTQSQEDTIYRLERYTTYIITDMNSSVYCNCI